MLDQLTEALNHEDKAFLHLSPLVFKKFLNTGGKATRTQSACQTLQIPKYQKLIPYFYKACAIQQ